MKLKKYRITIFADYPDNCTIEQIKKDIESALHNQVIVSENVYIKHIENTEEYKKREEKRRDDQRKLADEIAWHFSEYNPTNDPGRLMWKPH